MDPMRLSSTARQGPVHSTAALPCRDLSRTQQHCLAGACPQHSSAALQRSVANTAALLGRGLSTAQQHCLAEICREHSSTAWQRRFAAQQGSPIGICQGHDKLDTPF